jgi:transcriptional regulator with XRE-family HTH domain
MLTPVKTETRTRSTQPRAVEPAPFGVALGHRLRVLRERGGHTADDMARYARIHGLGWDRSTYARIELGQRTVTAAELLLLPRVFECPLTDLLPDEPVRLTDTATATPEALRTAVTRRPRRGDGWHLPQVEGMVEDGLAIARRLGTITDEHARKDYPEAAWAVMYAAGDTKDDATIKAAARLGASTLDVAVAAVLTWERSLAQERDARVTATGGATTARTQQARRGHVTRALLEELRPVIEELQQAREG